jgi:hypothetical protein
MAGRRGLGKIDSRHQCRDREKTAKQCLHGPSLSNRISRRKWPTGDRNRRDSDQTLQSSSNQGCSERVREARIVPLSVLGSVLNRDSI